MIKEYSTYEAKAKFSEMLSLVRKGVTVLILYRGERVAEINAIQNDLSDQAKLKSLEDRGIVSKTLGKKKLAPIAKKAGALARFLEERD